MAQYANDSLCHIWASGKVPKARSNHGSLFFEGRVLYSYGRHYAIAARMNDATVLFNSDRASVTTSKQSSFAWRAVVHMTRHNVPDLTEIASALAAVADGTAEDWQKAAIERHAKKHCLSMQPGATSYLMRLAGKRNPDKAAAIASAQAAREAKRWAAERAKRETAALLSMAKDIAALTPQEVQESINHLAAQWSFINALKTTGTGARRAHKAAKGKGWTLIAGKVWAYIKALDSKRQWLERNAANIERRKHLRRHITRLRGYIARHDSLTATELGGAIDTAQFILNHGKVPMPALQSALPALWARLDTLREREAAERFEREREARQAWLDGASGYWRGSDSNGGALIRATGVERDESGTISGGTLETSQGATVPLVHAVRIFQIARACREQGRAMEPRARCGFYTVDRIDETGGFNAGCHRINWPEIERLATILGLYP